MLMTKVQQMPVLRSADVKKDLSNQKDQGLADAFHTVNRCKK